MRRTAIIFFILVCVGDFQKICFDPNKVVAIYQDNDHFKTNTVIVLNDGTKLHTNISVDRITKAIEGVPHD